MRVPQLHAGHWTAEGQIHGGYGVLMLGVGLDELVAALGGHHGMSQQSGAIIRPLFRFKG